MTLFCSGIARGRGGFTLLELMTVMVIISILLVVVAPSFPYLQARAQKTKCLANLRSIQVATNSYIQDNQHWPQISSQGYGDTVAANAWINALNPYGLSQINWVCPSVQEALHSPDLTDPANTRVDYMAMPFGPQPRAPFENAKMPWFLEASDIHGNGQEIVFSDGHIAEAADVLRSLPKPSSGNAPAGGPTH